MAERPTFSYVIYIESTPEKVWHALTDADVTAAYWGHSNVSDWQVGSRVGAPAHGRQRHRRRRRHRRGERAARATGDHLGGPRRRSPPEARPGSPSRSSRTSEIVRLTVTHENLADEAEREDVAGGWAAVLSNLKSLLETGSPLPREPWLVGR